MLIKRGNKRVPSSPGRGYAELFSHLTRRYFREYSSSTLFEYRSQLRIGGRFALEDTRPSAAVHRCARWLMLPRASAITGDACEWATCVTARPTSAHCHDSIIATLRGSNNKPTRPGQQL